MSPGGQFRMSLDRSASRPTNARSRTALAALAGDMRLAARSRSIAAAMSRTRRQSVRGPGPVEVGVEGSVEAVVGVEGRPVEAVVEGPVGRPVRRNLAHAGAVWPFRSASTRARRRRWRSATSARSRSVRGRPIGVGLFGQPAPGACHGIRVAGASAEFFSYESEEATGAGRERMHLVRDPSRSVDQLLGWHGPSPWRHPQHSARGEPGQRRPAQSGRGRGSVPARCSVPWTKVAGSPASRDTGGPDRPAPARRGARFTAHPPAATGDLRRRAGPAR